MTYAQLAETILKLPYKPGPGGDGPLYWRDEQSGQLSEAIMAWLAGHDTPDQFAVVRAYGEYWVKAPCWANNPHDPSEWYKAELDEICATIKHVRTRAELEAWINRCMLFGIDPF